MADKVAKNQAQIDAAIAARARAERALAAAETAKVTFAEQNKSQILSGISNLTKGITDFTKSLKSGATGSDFKSSTAAAKAAIEASQQVTGQLNPQLATINQNITSAAANLASIIIPAPEYGSSEQTDMLTADAFALLEMAFRMYDLEELAPMIQQMMEEGVSPQRAALLLKTDPKYNRDAAGNVIGYQKRFYGNELRRQAGLNVLSEDAYLELENSYRETLKGYGLENYFGTSRTIAQSKMAQVIGGDVSAKEFRDRVVLATERVQNSDAMTRKSLNTFYNISDTDLVAYFLDPKQQLPALQEKVVSAEIGGAALMNQLQVDRVRAEELARLGVTKQSAREGYAGIASVLPTAEKLSDIYAQEGIDYTQTTGEQEAFMNLQSAKRAREKLISRELGAFAAKPGAAKGAFGGEQFV